MIKKYYKELELLFSDIKLTEIEQASDEWHEVRKTHITSSDICCIIMNFVFNQKDIYILLDKMLVTKVNPPPISDFMKNRMKNGKISEANLIAQMKNNPIFSAVFPSVHYLSKYCSVSPDVIAIKSESPDVHIVYELKYTVIQETFEAIKNGDNTNRFYKRHMIQLAYHMLAHHMWLKASGKDLKIVGVLLIGCPYKGKLSYASQEIDMQSIYVVSICKNLNKIINAIEDMRNNIEPFSKVEPSKELSDNLKKFMRLQYELNIVEEDLLHGMEKECINKLNAENPIGDAFTVAYVKRTSKSKTLLPDYDKNLLEELKQKKQLLDKKIIDDFYSVKEKESSSLRITKRKL